MNPRTRKIIIYLSLVAAVIYAAVNMTDKFRVETGVPMEPPTPHQPTAVKKAEMPIPIEKYRDLEWGRDPFRRNAPPAVVSENNAPGWTLNGILYDETDPSAIIDGKLVKVGAEINGARVLNIRKKAVTLDINGSSVELTLAKDKS
ncbi:MAG: hypothetical protein HRF51_02105 [bacterium]|jgi:hypothetical protein